MRGVLRLVHPGRATLAVLLGALTVLSGAALLAASGALISGAAQRPEHLLVLMPLITSVRLFGVSRAALRYAERLVSHDLTLRLVARLRAELLIRLVPLAPAALTGVRGGDLLARLRADVDELQGVVVRLLAPAAVAVVAGTVSVVLTALVSPQLAGVLAVLLLGLGVVVPAWARRTGRRAAVESAMADAAFGSDLLDLVRGLTDHLSGDGGSGALHALDLQLARQARAERATARLATVTTFLREAVPVLGVVAALWLVGWGVARGTTDPVLLAASALGVLGAFEAVGGLGAAWSAADGMGAAAERVRALGDERPAVVDPAHPLPRPERADLRFDRVTLRYPGSAGPAIEHFDLTVREGEKVALTGRSGAGKSSLLALALRARDPDAGRVTRDGTDLRHLSIDDVRADAGWSAQQPQLLSGTLAGNLRLARGDLPDVELEDVLRRVGLGDVLDSVGLHGWVGDSGANLSAGERARVGVARALLSPSRVLLLDEPTAHLDADGSRDLHALLLGDPRAVLLVTHSAGGLGPGWRVVDLDAASTGTRVGAG